METKGSSLTKTLTKTLAILIVFAVLATGASAQTSNKQAVVTVDSYTVTVGQEFTVPVRITGVSNINAADVRVTYNPALLQGVSVDHGYFLRPDYVVRQGFYGPPQCNPMCARYALTQIAPTPPVSGSGVLMYVTYRAVAVGVSSLTLRVELADRYGQLIPVTVQGGTVTVVDTGQDR